MAWPPFKSILIPAILTDFLQWGRPKQAPAGEYRTQHWPEDGVAADSGSRTGTKGLGVPAEGASVPSGGSPVDHSPAADVATPAEGQDPRGWRALIGSLETAWDQQLRACLEGALLLMLDPVRILAYVIISLWSGRLGPALRRRSWEASSYGLGARARLRNHLSVSGRVEPALGDNPLAHAGPGALPRLCNG